MTIVEARATTATAPCPHCHHESAHVHSRYLRSPRDLPIAEHAVRLRLTVRRFLCRNAACPHRTFAERLPGVVPFRAQRTTRFTQRLHALSGALSSEAGARLAVRLLMPTSPDTLLRLVRQTPIPPFPPPRVLGVDDFALRKGHTYATVLVDLERRCPIDVLPDRTAETLAQWLRAHPSVRIIARDRSLEYARGATLGAPQARQVADRWHLLHNLRDLVERVVLRRRAQLRRLPLPPDHAVSAAITDELTPTRPRRLRRPTASERTRQQESRARRYTRYDTVHALLAQGLSHRHIARLLGISRTTVRQFACAEQFPERATPAPTPSTLDAYLGFLHRRWQEGCHNSHQLWREMQAQGYPHGPRQVMRWAAAQRTEPAPSTPNAYRQGPGRESAGDHRADDQTTGVPLRLGAPRELVRRLLRDPAALTPMEQRTLSFVVQDPHIGTMHLLGQQFQQMIRTRQRVLLEPWLTAAIASTVPDLHDFAVAVQRDHDSVEAALEEEWSSGQVEGQVTRVKLIKRRMYGRANFDLLRQLILCGD